SRSATIVTVAAPPSTHLPALAVSIQRRDSFWSSGRFRCGTPTRPQRVHTAPATKPKLASLAASTATMACSSAPRPTPLPISPRPRVRALVVRKLISLVSWIASTCRPATAAPVVAPPPRNQPLDGHLGVGEKAI